MKFANVYKVTREFGGHEEGGWWYNQYVCLETHPVRKEKADEIVEFLKSEYKHHEHGDIYSVLGGQEIHVLVEDYPSASETKQRPTYQ